MASISTIESSGGPLTHPGEGVDPGTRTGAIAALGSWMVALGTIRVVCAIANLARAGWDEWTSGAIASLGWAEFFGEHPLVVVLISVWSLLLGLALHAPAGRS